VERKKIEEKKKKLKMATKNQHPEKKEKEGETEEINPDELADYESDEDDRAPAAGTKQTEKK